MSVKQLLLLLLLLLLFTPLQKARSGTGVSLIDS